MQTVPIFANVFDFEYVEGEIINASETIIIQIFRHRTLLFLVH